MIGLVVIKVLAIFAFSMALIGFLGFFTAMFFGMATVAFGKNGPLARPTKPYSAESMKQANDMMEELSDVESNTKLGAFGNKAAMLMTFSLVMAALFAGIEYVLARSLEVPSGIFG